MLIYHQLLNSARHAVGARFHQADIKVSCCVAGAGIWGLGVAVVLDGQIL